ncbi:MAG: M23 family metallopeptidase, partial [Methylococcales bacterium]|nr:M23 family metallopeptidase [Methylococcales bacterium]
MRYIATFLSVLTLVFMQSVVGAEESTPIDVKKSTFIYTNDVMLNFNVKDYLTDNYNDLMPFAETLTYWSGYTSVSPKILITLIVMQNSTNGSYTGVNSNNPFVALSDKTGFAEQTKDVAKKLSKAYYVAKQAGLPNPAGVAIQGLLSQNNQEAQQFTILLHQIFPETAALSTSGRGNQGAALPENFLQLPYPVGEEWYFGGTHTTGHTCKESSYLTCAENAIFSSMDFQKRFGKWGIDTSDTFISAAHGGTVKINSSCSIEIVSPTGWSTSYYHLDNILVASGEVISRDTPIAIYANNKKQALCGGGGSSGPHMHFSLKQDGEFSSLNNVSFSGYPVHAGRWDYDTDINYFWILVNGDKHGGFSTRLLNPGVSVGDPDPKPDPK